MKITYLGHSCFTIEVADKKILIDPFIKSNPQFTNDAWAQAQQSDFILITHGHSDHIGDAIELSKSKNATIISNYEICNWLLSQGVENCIDLNMGSVTLDSGIEISMVPAVHSSSIELDNGENLYAGLACGFLIKYDTKCVYHAGDTYLFSDMKLINDIFKPQIGLMPIGGRFTMSINDVIYACSNFFNFDTIIPMHYDTFPPISANPKILQEALSQTSVKILNMCENILI